MAPLRKGATRLEGWHQRAVEGSHWLGGLGWGRGVRRRAAGLQCSHAGAGPRSNAQRAALIYLAASSVLAYTYRPLQPQDSVSLTCFACCACTAASSAARSARRACHDAYSSYSGAVLPTHWGGRQEWRGGREERAAWS